MKRFVSFLIVLIYLITSTPLEAAQQKYNLAVKPQVGTEELLKAEAMASFEKNLKVTLEFFSNQNTEDRTRRNEELGRPKISNVKSFIPNRYLSVETSLGSFKLPFLFSEDLSKRFILFLQSKFPRILHTVEVKSDLAVSNRLKGILFAIIASFIFPLSTYLIDDVAKETTGFMTTFVARTIAGISILAAIIFISDFFPNQIKGYKQKVKESWAHLIDQAKEVKRNYGSLFTMDLATAVAIGGLSYGAVHSQSNVIHTLYMLLAVFIYGLYRSLYKFFPKSREYFNLTEPPPKSSFELGVEVGAFLITGFVATFILFNFGVLQLGPGVIWGNLAVIVAVFADAIFTFYGRRLTAILDTWKFIFASYVNVLLILNGVALFGLAIGKLWLDYSAIGFLLGSPFVWGAALAIILTLYFWFGSLKYIQPYETSGILAIISPFFGLLYGEFIFGQPIPPISLFTIFAGVIFIGSFLYLLSQHTKLQQKEKQEKEEAVFMEKAFPFFTETGIPVTLTEQQTVHQEESPYGIRLALREDVWNYYEDILVLKNQITDLIIQLAKKEGTARRLDFIELTVSPESFYQDNANIRFLAAMGFLKMIKETEEEITFSVELYTWRLIQNLRKQQAFALSWHQELGILLKEKHSREAILMDLYIRVSRYIYLLGLKKVSEDEVAGEEDEFAILKKKVQGIIQSVIPDSTSFDQFEFLRIQQKTPLSIFETQAESPFYLAA